LVDLPRHEIERMLAPLLGGKRVREASRVEGGLTNTIYRVAVDGEVGDLAVRVCAGRTPPLEQECRLLGALRRVLPVPEVLWADEGAACGYRFVAYTWIEGETLNEYRRRASPADWLRVAQPLGRVLGQLAAVPAAIVSWRQPRIARSAACALEHARSALAGGRARTRLGDPTADHLDALLSAHEVRLCGADAPGLMHGDFGGRNVLVREDAHGTPNVAAVLDWETAGTGSPLWDVGSLFRYSHRYGPEFREAFMRGYDSAGCELPGDWWVAARVLDATRLVAVLDEDRLLPTVFVECRELIARLLADQELLPLRFSQNP
jgi:aminoglycoside phosphotransferase (APT) family kinase protein